MRNSFTAVSAAARGPFFVETSLNSLLDSSSSGARIEASRGGADSLIRGDGLTPMVVVFAHFAGGGGINDGKSSK